MSIDSQIVSVEVDNDKAKYINYKGDVILEVDLPVARELQQYYQRNYKVRDFTLATSLTNISRQAENGFVERSLLDVAELLNKRYEDEH